MTAFEELQAFAEAVKPFCVNSKINFACLKAEHDLEQAPRWSLRPYLYLTLVSEELACGHLVATAEGRNLFIRVRTPFAASSSIKFVSLRTYSLILIQYRGLAITRYERKLNPLPSDTDPMELVAQAADLVTRLQTADRDFLQPELLAPLKTKNAEQVVARATFCSGAVTANVLPPDSAPEPEAAAPSS